MLRICFPVSRLSLTGDIMATSTISYEYNESGSWATITPYAGLYYSTDDGGTKTPITESRLPIVSTLTLYYRDATQTYCTFAVFFNGSSTISYTALVVSGMGCAISNGEQASGSLTVVTDAMQKSEADPPAKPVTLTFAQPEEGQNKVNQVRVSVNGGALSTASPVEIPAGGSAEVSYSYTPFDNYLGPNKKQPVSFDVDTTSLIITPVVDNLYYSYLSEITNRTKMNMGTEYRLKLYNNDNVLDRLTIYQKKDSNYAAFAQTAFFGGKNRPAVVGPHISALSGYVAIQFLYPEANSTEWLIADTTDGIEVTVNHTDTTTPEVQ